MYIVYKDIITLGLTSSAGRPFFFSMPKALGFWVAFLAENLNKAAKWEHRIWQVKRKYGLSPNPYTSRKSKSTRWKILIFLLCSFLQMNWWRRIMNWLRHDFSLRSMNCNEYHARRVIHAVYCNSWHAVSIHATSLQFIACSPLRMTRFHRGLVLLLFLPFWGNFTVYQATALPLSS